jgi:hypothetical protein
VLRLRPRAELLARTREFDPEVAELFAEPVCLKARYGGLTGNSFEAYTHKWEVRMKAAHLARLVADYRGPSESLAGSADRRGAGRRSGLRPWWTLEFSGPDTSADDGDDDAAACFGASRPPIVIIVIARFGLVVRGAGRW